MILPDVHGGADGKWRVIAYRDEDSGFTVFLEGSRGDDPMTPMEAASYAASLAPFANEDEQGLWWGARSFAVEALRMAKAAASAWSDDGVARE